MVRLSRSAVMAAALLLACGGRVGNVIQSDTIPVAETLKAGDSGAPLLQVARKGGGQVRVQVQPHTVALTGSDARATLQGYARDKFGPVPNTVWTWTVRTAGVIQSIASTKSAVTLVPVANGSTIVVGTAWAQKDSSTITVSGITPSTGELVAQADSFVGTIGVQLHVSYSGVYQTLWTTVRARMLESGIRNFRERMNGAASNSWSRWGDLLANGIQMTAGCWPLGTNYSDASHCFTYANQVRSSADSAATAQGKTQPGTGAIAAFDGWNEVDGRLGAGFAPAWVSWETTFFNAKNANGTWSGKPLYANSLAAASSADAVVSASPAGNKSATLDYGNMHPYPGGGGLPSNVSTSWIPQWKKIAGTKPLVATETAYHTCPACTDGVGVNELAQAKYVGRLFFEYFNRNVKKTFWYEFINEGTATTTRENHWGLLFSDGSPKQSFTAVKNIIAHLEDPGVSFDPGRYDVAYAGANATTRHTLLGKRDGTKVIAIWQDLSTYNTSTETSITNATDAVTLTLPAAVAAVNIYNPRTNVTTSLGGGTVFSVPVPDEVVLVEVTP